MQLNLTDDEVPRLGKILKSYLGDLRMEISNTDSMDLREELKQEEEFLKSLLVQLES